MNLLIVVEGYKSNIPPPTFFKEQKIEKIWLLNLSPRVKVFEHRKELQAIVKKGVEIEVVNPKKLVDFEATRKALLDFIGSMPGRLKVGASNLSEYMTIDGLNLWWTSGLVETTIYKRNLFQNLYYLSAVKKSFEKYGITDVWFDVEDKPLKKDLVSLIKNSNVKYKQGLRTKSYTWHDIKYFIWKQTSVWWLFLFGRRLFYSIFLKILFFRGVKPQKSDSNKKGIHLFYGYYPYQTGFFKGDLAKAKKGGVPRTKVYGDLPSFLPKHMGGETYCLSYLANLPIAYFPQLVKDMRKFKEHNFRFIPMDLFVSMWEILKLSLSPARHWKYYCLTKMQEYRKVFRINDLDIHHTFDKAIKDSIVGYEALQSFRHFYAYRRFCRQYAKNIFQVVYYLEFHDWEAAVISGVRVGDKSVPIVGLQQSAPNPILLSFYFSLDMFKDKNDCYPLPDLVLCSGKIHKDLFISNGIDKNRLEVIGHILGQYLSQPLFSEEMKQQKRREIGFSPKRKICLVPCSIKLPITEGIICLLKDVVRKLPEILFLIQGHPNSPIAPLLKKYNMHELENVKSVKYPISTLLPLSDCFLSTSTSVSQEALWWGLPQVNLDVGVLPKANPLHLEPDLVADVETPDQLFEFLNNTEKFCIPKEKSCLFMGDSKIDPRQRFLEIVNRRFHDKG